VASLVFQYIQNNVESSKWILGGMLGRALFPYVILICLAAIISAALNLLGKFGVPALTAVWLNSSMLLFLGIGGWLWGENELEKMIFLCVGTMVGGILQMIAPALALMREGWRPRLDFGVSERLKTVVWLTVPGIFGASVHQINVMVTRGLAFDFSDAGATLIYLANRLVELPVGVFAIAISTVVFPSLSKFAAKEDRDSFQKTYADGIVLGMMMAVPAMVGLMVLAKEIIEMLFQHGVFTWADTRDLIPVVTVYALGIPALSFVSIETRAFFSLKDTKTPVKIAAAALIVNLVFSLWLRELWGVVGLAAASNVALLVQGVALHLALKKKRYATSLGGAFFSVGKMVLAAVAMGAVIWGGTLVLGERVVDAPAMIVVGLLIPLGSAVYFSVLKAMRVDQLDEALLALSRRKRHEETNES
ncbi:MAG: murein biosynthesis integral membrane protein MurJ, partial [Verrucomicrobiota bacterium]